MTAVRLAFALSAALLTAAEAAPCGPPGARPNGKAGASRPGCPPVPPRRFEPYDPDAARAGRRPGFIDLGGGTEIRVGGRVRADYEMRR